MAVVNEIEYQIKVDGSTACAYYYSDGDCVGQALPINRVMRYLQAVSNARCRITAKMPHVAQIQADE